MRNVIQSFKKVLNYAPTSIGAASNSTYNLTEGEDSVAAGQSSVTDSKVPTGSIVKYIEVQFALTNLVSVSSFAWVTLQRVHSGQGVINSNAVGGDKQRNQILHQDMFSVGQDQNANRKYKFKIPKKYQRVREGDKWVFVVYTDQISTQAAQVIYKFYR